MKMQPLNLLPKQDEETHTPIVRRVKERAQNEPPKSSRRARTMSLTVEDEMIVIRLPISTKPVKSKSGKSTLYGSTRGPRRVTKQVDGKTEYVEIDGGYLRAIASAFVTTDAKEKKQTS